jgi:hypothetical protein
MALCQVLGEVNLKAGDKLSDLSGCAAGVSAG